MSENQKDKLRNIKQQLHHAMNGVASTSMRQRGLDYRVNFGLSALSLKKMAAEIGQNHELAQLMWAENIRDLRILATYIQPIETFTDELANEWVKTIQFPEEAENAAMNLFQKMDNAKSLALQWIDLENEMERYAGWQLLSRIVPNCTIFSPKEIENIIHQATVDIINQKLLPFTGAMLGLKKVGRTNLQIARQIYEAVKLLEISNLNQKEAILDDLKFEFEYSLNTSL